MLLSGACSTTPAKVPSPTISAWQVPSAQTSGSESAAEQLPLQQYMLMGRDRETVVRAHTVLTQKCMERQGFKVTLPKPVPEAGSSVDLASRRYGLNSLSDAKQFGFHTADDTPEIVAGRAASDEFNATLTPAQQKALGGEPVSSTERFREGCLGEADKTLMEGTTQTHFAGLGLSPIVRSVNLDPRATDSPKTTTGLKAFAACMSAAGYPEVADPREAPRKYLGADAVTPDETKAAVTQFECQESSGVTKAMREAETTFQRAAIDANPEGFATVKGELATLVRHASEVTTNG
ncbi:hypothetical protein AAEX63_08940 [Luteococcus sp. H138]|uniref:hypothetical protein n=1 Tax=unclassified Luteococcus TaxID=2639923 RepID=UPI00313C2513